MGIPSQQRSMPNENVWEKRLLEQPTTSRQPQPQPQPTRILKRAPNDPNTTTTPKSTPASTSTQGKPNFVEVAPTIVPTVKEQQTSSNSSTVPSSENSILLRLAAASSILPSALVETSVVPQRESATVKTTVPPTTETTAPLRALPTNPGPESLLLRAIQESKHIQSPAQQQPTIQTAISQSTWDAIPPPLFPVIQDQSTGIPISPQQAWESIPTPSLPILQQSPDSFISRQQTWTTPPRSQAQNSVFAQAIENMSRAPPASLISPSFEQKPALNITPPQQQFQQAPFSILQQAIQQSNQQFSMSQTSPSSSNGLNGMAPPFQPFDMLFSNAYPGFPLGPTPNLIPQAQQSPVQPNNVRLSSPQTMSSPSVSQNSPSAQQTGSPRAAGASTLQFVPSQVLRNMPKSHK